MKPEAFPQVNVQLAKDQDSYQTLPTWRGPMDDGTETTISCWSFTWRERLAILFGRRLWIRMLTFKRPPLPILPTLEAPEWRMEA